MLSYHPSGGQLCLLSWVFFSFIQKLIRAFLRKVCDTTALQKTACFPSFFAQYFKTGSGRDALQSLQQHCLVVFLVLAGSRGRGSDGESSIRVCSLFLARTLFCRKLEVLLAKRTVNEWIVISFCLRLQEVAQTSEKVASIP
jgi:hypothetical protein